MRTAQARAWFRRDGGELLRGFIHPGVQNQRSVILGGVAATHRTPGMPRRKQQTPEAAPKIVKLPPSLRRCPRAAPAVGHSDMHQHVEAQRVQSLTDAEAAQYTAAGDAPTFARPVLQPAATTPAWMQAVRENGAHMLFAGGTASTAGLVLINSITSPEVFFTAKLAQAMLMNLPVPCLCAAAGDVVAQLLTGTRDLWKLDMRRTVSAGVIGGSLQGFGTTAWLWHLNIGIPRSMVGFDSLSQGAWLIAKVLLDSAAWGTLINTLNVCARRVAAGDSLVQAHSTWRDKIVGITRSEFKFWPAFGAVVYTCVGEAQQVNAIGFGGFIWSVYLSYAANHFAKSNEHSHFRYGRPTGVRIKASTSSLDEPEWTQGRVVLARFDGKSSQLPLHGAVGRPRISRCTSKHLFLF